MIDNLTALTARDDLLHVARSWPELRTRLAAGGGNALTGLPTGDGDPIPINVAVSDLMRLIEDRTRLYARILVDEVAPEHGCDGGCHGAPGHRCACPDGVPAVAATDCPTRRDPVTTSTMSGLLVDVAHRYGHFTTSHGRLALDFTDDAHELARMVDGLLTPREPATYLGPCPVDDLDGAGCPGELYLRPDCDRGWCAHCGIEFTRDSQVRYLEAELSARLMTRSELLSALVVLDTPVPESTLRTWIRRGRLPEQDGGLYRLTDAHELARSRRRRAGRMAA